jgi:hypothetical protein
MTDALFECNCPVCGKTHHEFNLENAMFGIGNKMIMEIKIYSSRTIDQLKMRHDGKIIELIPVLDGVQKIEKTENGMTRLKLNKEILVLKHRIYKETYYEGKTINESSYCLNDPDVPDYGRIILIGKNETLISENHLLRGIRYRNFYNPYNGDLMSEINEFDLYDRYFRDTENNYELIVEY